MSFFSTPYKYGRKTKAQISSLNTSILSIGDNVYNTDILKEEFWTGTSWVNEDCIEATNTSGGTLTEGQVVNIDNGSPAVLTASVELSTNVTDNWGIGVVYRGGANNGKVVIAMKGLYKVLFNTATTSTTRQQIAQISGTAGEANSTGSKVGGAGSFGVIAESYGVGSMPADRLIFCWLNSMESF
jgi:hypothetical protein